MHESLSEAGGMSDACYTNLPRHLHPRSAELYPYDYACADQHRGDHWIHTPAEDGPDELWKSLRDLWLQGLRAPVRRVCAKRGVRELDNEFWRYGKGGQPVLPQRRQRCMGGCPDQWAASSGWEHYQFRLFDIYCVGDYR